MRRPRSIPRLVVTLVALSVTRRPRTARLVLLATIVTIVTIAMCARLGHRGDPAPVDQTLQTAVSRDGFVAMQRTGGELRVIEIDPRGVTRKTTKLAIEGDVRVVGTEGGTAAAWQEGQRIRLVAVEGNRDLGRWGKTVRHLCEGVASSDTRFGVAWLEADQSVWLVHGPVASSVLDAEIADEPDVQRQVAWCGVATAQDDIALIWREQDQLKWVMCTKKKCSGLGTAAKLDLKAVITGAGCLRNACLIASRDPDGATTLGYAAGTGRMKWSVPLAASPTTRVSIVGIGPDAFAVGIATEDGPIVTRIDRKGESKVVWQDKTLRGAPSLAWASGKLLVSWIDGETLGSTIVSLPR